MLIGICSHFPLPPAIDRPRRTPCQPFLTLSPIRSGVGKSYNSLLVESPLARRRPCTPHGCHRQPPQGQTSRLPRPPSCRCSAGFSPACARPKDGAAPTLTFGRKEPGVR